MDGELDGGGSWEGEGGGANPASCTWHRVNIIERVLIEWSWLCRTGCRDRGGGWGGWGGWGRRWVGGKGGGGKGEGDKKAEATQAKHIDRFLLIRGYPTGKRPKAGSRNFMQKTCTAAENGPVTTIQVC